ncbi:anti-sigma factor RsbA family regulatory protein [Streptacidiphilus cavernicola]|uniref:Anti-sigma factor RsbA family regulatory protein n=1 Tax=Streptacidiphilus cavernicola TaxID=3342716 RepID=A0ABV6VP13_9ACTN
MNSPANRVSDGGTTTGPTPPDAGGPGSGFRHELYAYQGEAQFLAGTLSFIDDALTGGEIVLVAVAEAKQHLLREQLNGHGKDVSFLDVDALGRNPARLIPAWQSWIAECTDAGRPVRGIGESRWTGRSQVEAAELRYHEWLLNLAFVKSPAWWLLCPYDTDAASGTVLEALGRCHPLQFTDGGHGPSPTYQDSPYDFDELGPPCDPHHAFAYGPGQLGAVREKVADCATAHGLDGTRLRELLIAATEVATNSINHGGGHGTLRVWTEETDLVCEFHDAGYIDNPLIGRVRPHPDQVGGHGMWLVQQLCDLVRIRSTPDTGTTVRLYTTLPPKAG